MDHGPIRKVTVKTPWLNTARIPIRSIQIPVSRANSTTQSHHNRNSLHLPSHRWRHHVWDASSSVIASPSTGSEPVTARPCAGSTICPSSFRRIWPSAPRSGISGSSSRLERWNARKNCLVVRYRWGRPGTCSRPHSSMSLRSCSSPMV